MAAQLGTILAAIHRIPLTDDLPRDPATRPNPASPPPQTELHRFEQTYRMIAPDPHPAFELAFRWLRATCPRPPTPRSSTATTGWATSSSGRRASAPSLTGSWPTSATRWRTSASSACAPGASATTTCPSPASASAKLYSRAYEAAGGRRVDPNAVRWWETFGNLRWGIICIMQASAYLDGMSKSVELAAIGRRTAETEWELSNLMETA